jgi:Cu(I)/Ag(I) efflux system membrane protein CusA/SilA
MFGMSFVYVLFEEGTDVYWARSRVLEYLSSLSGRLPEGVVPSLGPDATGIGWVYQYALVDRTGQHDLGELRSLHDYVTCATRWRAFPASPRWPPSAAIEPQYQVTLDPERLRAFGVTVDEVAEADAPLQRRGGRPRHRALGARVLRPRARLFEGRWRTSRRSRVRAGPDGATLRV